MMKPKVSNSLVFSGYFNRIPSRRNGWTLVKSILFLVLLSMTWACGVPGKLSKKDRNELHRLVEKSPVFSKSFTGFVLYDPESRQTLYQKDADKYFTPASNTKIFTLYTSLKLLGDSLPVLRYVIRGDSLIFQGVGNPMFLHPDFEQSSRIFDFLKSRPGELFFSADNFQDERFGPGWGWDDYEGYYQPEKASFPIYGNVARFSGKANVEVGPDYFYQYLVYDPELGGDFPWIRREETGNLFRYNKAAATGRAFRREVPFDYSPEFLTVLLKDTLGRQVQLIDAPDEWMKPAALLQIPTPDTLYRRLMKDSDNFIAEQLMLMTSARFFGYLRTRDAIALARDSLFYNLPDPLEWWDGSGLSRYNLFTPRTIAGLLEKLYREYPREWLFSILPAGGNSGTIRDWYAGDDGPYVFAKTGSLRNKHCLSGYLLTRSGKVLIFSFMHNNFTSSSTPLKEEMEKVLRWISNRL